MRALSSLVLLTLATACGSNQPTQVGKCNTAADCASNQICNVHGNCQTTFGCHTNADCGANKTCDTTSGTCLCQTDQACATDEFCNINHRCQVVGPCVDNTDCPATQICDVFNKNCIAATSCGGTLQCPLGQVCQPNTSTCSPGCTNSGDCPQTVIDGGVLQYVPQGCIGGQCVKAECTANAGCAFQQICTSQNTCASGCSQAPYCRACDPTSFINQCGGNNLCLDDPNNAATCQMPGNGCNFWCGTDCSGGQACPSGFSCGPVVIVTQATACNCGQQCSNGTGPCQCQEGAASGVCFCTSDLDCGTSGATCLNNYCTIGQNCFPIKGFDCGVNATPCP